MVSNNLKKMITSVLLGLLLLVVIGAATGDTVILTGSTWTVSNFVSEGSVDSGGRGGGGGGGGGGASGENFTNIEVNEKYDLHIFKDQVTSYTFTNSSNPVLFVNITGNVNAGEINTAVEVLRGTSTLVKSAAQGIVNKNINIWVGTYGFAVPKNIKEAAIKFKVENSWISGNNLAASDVKMVKWDGNQWVQLETIKKTKDNTYTYYEAKTDSFSSFAISGLKGVFVPTATPAKAAVTVTITASPTETMQVSTAAPTEKASGFEIIFVIIILCAVYLIGRKRR